MNIRNESCNMLKSPTRQWEKKWERPSRTLDSWNKPSPSNSIEVWENGKTVAIPQQVLCKYPWNRYLKQMRCKYPMENSKNAAVPTVIKTSKCFALKTSSRHGVWPKRAEGWIHSPVIKSGHQIRLFNVASSKNPPKMTCFWSLFHHHEKCPMKNDGDSFMSFRSKRSSMGTPPLINDSSIEKPSPVDDRIQWPRHDSSFSVYFSPHHIRWISHLSTICIMQLLCIISINIYIYT